MDTSTTSIEGGSKKVQLEELTKEELVKKCRSLLTIAQKAKQARDVLVEENNKLKQSPPVNTTATEELIESFTQQKLDLVTKNDTLVQENKQLQEQLNQAEEKLASLDTESQVYKRQVSRLTEENEQLLTHLDGLETQINELKRIGLEQQQQLLILEQNNEAIAEKNELNELQKMLTVSLDEIKKLKDENKQIQEVVSEKEAIIISLNDTLANYDFNSQKYDESKALLLQKDEELQRQTRVIDDLNTELHKNRALAEKLKQDISNTSKRFNDNQIESSGINAELQNSNEKLREKLKSYHGKIVKLAGDVRKVKESKEYILDTFKVYNQQVQLWQEQLKALSLRLQQEVQLNFDEKQKLQKRIDELEEKLKEMENLTVEKENLHKTVDVMRSQMTKLNEDVADGKEKYLEEVKHELEVKSDTCNQLTEELSNEKEIYEKLRLEYNGLLLDNNKLSQDLLLKTNENDDNAKLLAEMQATLHTQTEDYSKLKEEYTAKVTEFEATIEGNIRLVSELKKAIERLESDLESSRITESKLAEQTSETIRQLRQEKKTLEDEIEELHLQQETAAQPTLKSENAELLAEMNVMNQALKERGETISQQQAHCEELVKKIQVYEGQLAKSQEHVQSLQEEVQSLRSQVNQDDYDALSTSTISKCDEINRMKELEGSWEERYGKLRTYAVKLKAKAKEMQDDAKRLEVEKSELQGRVATHMKTVQSMQAQIDALHDKIDLQKETKSKMDQTNKDNQRLLQQLASNEETIQKLTSQVEGLTQEKTNLDSWKKQVGTKVQALKKELEANTLMRKDFESRITKLQADLAAKEKELSAEKEKHTTTKSQLNESNNECKKQSVLNLEMQDYERSIKDLSAKLEKKNEQVTKLKNQIDAQKSSVSSTKEQNRLMEEKCSELETELDACRIEIRTFKKQIADLEITIGDKESKIDETLKSLEATRSENEDLSTQLSKIIAEHQKVNQLLREEKDHFRNENVDLESRLRQLSDQLKLRSDELDNVNAEYQSYKVRAQSVLRQNQSRDVGVEEKLTEEAASLRAQMKIYQSEIDELKLKLKTLETSNQKLQEEKNDLDVQQKEIQEDLSNAQVEIEKLNAKHLLTIQEHNETVRSLKLHTETLSQCYRQQISEQEVRHNREIIELQSKYDKNPPPQTDIPSLIIPTSIREEGEGSESVDSTNGNNIHPLEKLLGSDQDQELAAVKKNLNENELRVVHLTALLADTEQDLSKHMQMNKVLKEEIRRQQRSVERERHAENLEYMKNVVFKFITLNNGDERLRLVPVLNTILKLSPEETNKLNLVAKGDKSWSNYLPLWAGAGGSKPQ
ncbi:GRIP and coiled-coil domain-containing protein 2 [Atheta coriaria]|uniref:GRIP and coiled-coil domain-containing protein 2 n=1 Tax=Dalotia coriaria TaxID=877792 RepID=UPI0031F34CEC